MDKSKVNYVRPHMSQIMVVNSNIINE